MRSPAFIFNKIPSSFSTKLDIARGLAAGLVAVSHLRGGFFVSYDHLLGTSHNFFNYLLFFITRLGHEAVIVFFVLSGYLVGGAILSEWVKGNPDWAKYLVNRITRMWTVLLPALVIGAAFDFITLSLNPSTPGASNFSFINFIGNAFFLQTITVPTFGTNGTLWSLANEFWYYLLWPAILLLLSLTYRPFFKWMGVILFLAGCYLLAPGILKLFPIWVAGALIRVIKNYKVLRSPWYAVFSYLFVVGALGFSNIVANTAGEYLLGLAFCLLILGWQYSKESIVHPMFSRLAHFFSEFSFSLYAVHYFFMFFVFELLKTYAGIPIRLTHAGIVQWFDFVLLVAITYAWAYTFYWFTERHTPMLRKIVLKKLVITKE